ncbi:MAG TPA: hypothetical protein DGO89_14085 [Microcoleaceae bacterium UBA9251]|jgi:hypothetical protein|uniref:CRISPR type III-B/RAMP module-associated protein Cmr5 n=1 Tax=uncultured Phormidium sp. TaxID=259949 RepID=W0FKY2_9CYAN|nr:hypothetical protein [uncultured Phormidium sp.]AHF23491.1 hypothetical protein [uncultured Phormidium sp.]HCV31220.1 hypothetical protein [Microcoleaceae cyanobacterium UBA9251]
MAWESYKLDQEAHDLVIKYRDKKDAPNQAYKMRVSVAYGLERFWGEQFRLVKDKDKADYWRDTWKALVKIMANAGVKIPNDNVSPDDTAAIKIMANKLWDFPVEQRKVAIAVLTQLCDSMVWWTQRYKPTKSNGNSGGEKDE